MSSFRHRRDFRESRTDVVVKGIGFEAGHQIWTRYQTHRDDYPCRYLPNGWGGKPYTDPEIGTQARCDAVATSIGDRVWGGLGQIVFRTRGFAKGATRRVRFHVGDLIALFDPAEGQTYIKYPIRDVKEIAGNLEWTLWEITVGDVQPDIVDIIHGQTTVLPQQAAYGRGGMGAQVTGAGLAGAGMPGTPRQIAVTNTPTHSNRNVTQPAFTTVVAHTYRAGTQLPAGADPFAPPAPANQLEHYSSADVKTQWTDNNGVHHPLGVVMQWAADGTKYFTPWADGVGYDVSALERSGSPSAVLSFTLDTGSGPNPVSPPFDAPKSARIAVTATGVDSSNPLVLTFREQDQAVVVIP